MKPPRVPASLVRDRHPLGVLPNALPVLWLALPSSGEYWIMKESSDGPVCLAVIPIATVEAIAASRQPVTLVPA